MIRDSMLSKLNEASGSTLVGMASDLGSTPSAESIDALEIVLFYCSDVHSQDGKWSAQKLEGQPQFLQQLIISLHQRDARFFEFPLPFRVSHLTNSQLKQNCKVPWKCLTGDMNFCPTQ
jgi:hypothetical protein